MSLHDLPKVMTKQQLAKLGYRAPETLLRSLYEVYGLHLEPKPAFIQALNDIETALKLREIGKILAEIDVSYHAGIWHELKLLERASDVTDTKINRAEELGFVYRPFDSEKFLREAGENMAAFLSHWYEKTFQLRPVAFCRSSQARLGSSK